MLASLWEERGAGLLSPTASSSVASSSGASAAAVATSGVLWQLSSRYGFF